MYTCIKRIFLLSFLCCNTISIKPMDSAMGMATIAALGQAVDLVVNTYYEPKLTDSAQKIFASGQNMVAMSTGMNMAFSIVMGFANYTLLKSSYYNPLCNILSWCIAAGYMYRYKKGIFNAQDSKTLFAGGCVSKTPIYIISCLFPRAIHRICHMRSALYA
jgi:hypothetical protein